MEGSHNNNKTPNLATPSEKLQKYQQLLPI